LSLPFYERINTLNRSKSILEAKWATGRFIGSLLGVPLTILAFQLSRRISGYVHSFYVDDGPFPLFLFAPIWVEILLFLGGLIMIILSIAVPIYITNHILKRISKNRYAKTNAEIIATWNELRDCFARLLDCPVTLEYSHPYWITAIYNAIESERANSVAEAIQILEYDEKHRQHINAQAEAQRAFLEEQKHKQRTKTAEDEFELLFWLNEMDF